MPADTATVDNENRLQILKMINMCETNGKLLDTRVIDQLLSVFNSEECFVCPTYSTVEGQMAPYYGKYIDKLSINENAELILVPLCDGSHFYSYIIDLERKIAVHIDSIYPRKTGRRSIGARLIETFFPAESDISFSSFYESRVQFDGYSCGAWSVVDCCNGCLCFGNEGNMAFNLMIVLIEDIDVNEKRIKAIDIFHVDDAIIVKTDKNYSDSLTLTNTRKSKRCVIDDSSDEEKEQNNDNDLLFDNVILSKSSTPRSGKKTCLKPEFYDEIPRIENDSSDPDLDEFKFEHIPELSELSTDTSFDGKECGNGSDKLDGDLKSEELQHDVSPYIAEPEVDGYPLKGSLSAREIISILKHIGGRRMVTSLLDGHKENVYYIVSENNNELRSTTGKRKQYPDDCGVWDSSKGHTVNSFFFFGENNNVKYLSLQDGIYCTEKTISGRKTYERIVPQPSAESVLTLSQYYAMLKRSNQYKR